MERFDLLLPRTRARITGAVYLMYFVLAIVGQLFLTQAGISAITPVNSDASTLARNVLSHQAALQLGIALELIGVVCYVAVTALLYQLLKPVGNTFALLALSFGLVAMAITALSALFEIGPLVVLRGTSGGFTPEQRQGLALTVLQLGDQLGPIGLVFSAFFQLLNGYLMFRSGFLPRILGILFALAGLGWLVYLAPPVSDRLMTYLEVLGFLGEVPLMLWLLVMGVNSRAYPSPRLRGEGRVGGS